MSLIRNDIFISGGSITVPHPHTHNPIEQKLKTLKKKKDECDRAAL